MNCEIIKQTVEMLQINLTPSIYIFPKTVVVGYYTTDGVVKLYLHPDGEYFVTLNCLPYTADCNDDNYIFAKKTATQAMYEAYCRHERYLRNFHRRLSRPLSAKDVANKIKICKPSTYKRKPFPLFKPSSGDIMRELEEDAKVHFSPILEMRQQEVNDYVMSRVQRVYIDRLDAYREAQLYHEKIQDYKEKLYNAQASDICAQQRGELLRNLEGDNEYTAERLVKILHSLKLPFPLSVKCDYHQAEQRLVTAIFLTQEYPWPEKRAFIGPDGSIRIENISDNEIEFIRTECLVSLLYYMAGSMFNATVNINTHKISLRQNDGAVLLAMQIDRSELSSTDMQHVSILKDFYYRKHKANIKVDGNTLCVLPI